MDKDYSSPIATIREATGLPLEIWPTIPSLQAPRDGIVGYKLGETVDGIDCWGNSHWIRVHDRTISALQSLPAAQVLGQSVLVRTESKFTAMVSIAEAAYVLLGEAHSSLLWVLLEYIERELRAHSANDQRWASRVMKRKEISLVEHIMKLRSANDEERIWEEYQEGLREERWNERSRETRGVLSMLKNPEQLGKSSESGISDQIAQIEHEQTIFGAKLDSIQEQNEQIFHGLKALSGNSVFAIDLLSGMKSGEEATRTSSGPVSTMTEDRRYYEDTSEFILSLEKDDKQLLILTDNSPAIYVLVDMLAWIEVALGGRGFTTTSSFLSQCIRLEDDNHHSLEKVDLPSENPRVAQACWRKKILCGNVLRLSSSVATATSRKATGGTSHGIQPLSHPFPESKDGLLLTGAALWSLFDNAVERIPHCNCTFITEGGDFIQCKSRSGKWFLWHVFSDEKPCDGQQCGSNVCVALTAEEPGERVYTTSPCVLGWAAKGRTKPDSPLWNTLKVSTKFRKHEYTKYEVKEFQAQAQLSIPAVVSPQIGGAISFAKRNYKVANSIDHASNLATDIAAATVVLIFDERRGIHFACDGADIIEILCSQYLVAMGLDTSDFPPFTHPTASQRIRTWLQSSFVSPTGTYITGDFLVREASKKVSQLVELTKNASQNDSALLYWLLEDVLRGNMGMALKAPRTEHVSWHNLAFDYPPLIFAVGEIDATLITTTGSTLKWTTPGSKPITISKLRSHLKGMLVPHAIPGGIVGSHKEVQRWLLQAQPFYMANLKQTEDQVIFGDQETDSEYTYRVAQCIGKDNFSGSVFVSCQDCPQNESCRCLHYIE